MEVFGTVEPGGLMDQFLKQKLKENINEAFDNIKHVTTLLQNINTLLAEIPEPIKHILNLGFVADLYVDNKQVFVQTTGTYGALKAIVKDTENLIEDKHREEEKNYEETKKKGNPQEDMRTLETMLNSFESELKELLPKMSQAEKNLVKNKIDAWENVV